MAFRKATRWAVDETSRATSTPTRNMRECVRILTELDIARARPNAKQLFVGFAFYSLQEHKRQQTANAIAEADPEVIRARDVEELTKQFAEEFIVEAPTLIEGALSINAEEAQIDVTGDFRFGAF